MPQLAFSPMGIHFIHPEQQFPNGQSLRETCEKAVEALKELKKIPFETEIYVIRIDRFPNDSGGYDLTVILTDAPDLHIRTAPIRH